MGRVEWRVQAINHAGIDQFGRVGIEVHADWRFCRLGRADMLRFATASPRLNVAAR